MKTKSLPLLFCIFIISPSLISPFYLGFSSARREILSTEMSHLEEADDTGTPPAVTEAGLEPLKLSYGVNDKETEIQKVNLIGNYERK